MEFPEFDSSPKFSFKTLKDKISSLINKAKWCKNNNKQEVQLQWTPSI